MNTLKKGLIVFVILVINILQVSCSLKESYKEAPSGTNKDVKHAESNMKKTEILVAAAASLQYVMEELQIMFKEQYPNDNVIFTYGSSGALQQQIEQGAPIDVFISAAQKQMDTLLEKDFIIKETKIDLLENKVVLIIPKESKLKITNFEDMLLATRIAIGEPSSVPVGYYAEQIFNALNILEGVNKKVVYAKDATEVLTWVSSGNIDAGVVYSTDAVSSSKVTIVAEATKGSCERIIYPAAVIKGTKEEKAASNFINFLVKEEASEVFIRYGFIPLNK